MSLGRLRLAFACLVLVLGWTGAAAAQQTYMLSSGSGAQLQIGGGLPLPIQLTDANNDSVADWGGSAPIAGGTVPTMGPGGGVYPPLLIPRKHPFVTVMGTTAMTMGQQLTVPAGVLSAPAAYKVLGVNNQNNKLYAVATNIGFKWPAATATFMQRTMTPTASGGNITFFAANTMTVYKATLGTRKITYKNTGVAAPFGGAARFALTPVAGAGLKPSLAVTVYGIAKIPTGNPPCTHPAFGGANPACAAALLKAVPAASGAIGGKALLTVTTPGGAIPGKNVAVVKAGASPKGTILAAALAATNTAVPTNMASSTGFFWTTGMLAVRAPGAAGTPEHWFLTGADNRTTMGAGTVQLVSGALSLRVTSGPNANRGWVQLVLAPSSKVPSISDAGLAVLTVALLGIAVVAQQRLRRRGAVA